MWASAWRRLVASQQLLLASAIMAMVLFAVVTIPADVRHALSSHQPLSWLVAVVVYTALLAIRRLPLATVAIATVPSGNRRYATRDA